MFWALVEQLMSLLGGPVWEVGVRKSNQCVLGAARRQAGACTDGLWREQLVAYYRRVAGSRLVSKTVWCRYRETILITIDAFVRTLTIYVKYSTNTVE